MDRDVLMPMIGARSVIENDEFGREQRARRSLLLDTALQGYDRKSQSYLLRLPAEVLTEIVDLLAENNTALASFAQVNSDCRQLARRHQFAKVQLDYSHPAWDLVAKLAEEVTEEKDDPARPSTIGVCIRQVTFISRCSFAVAHYNRMCLSLWGRAASPYSEQEMEELERYLGKDYERIETVFMKTLVVALPNIEAITWRDSYLIGKDFFEKLSRSSVQHIYMKRALINQSCSMQPGLELPLWPLRSLDIDISMDAELHAEPNGVVTDVANAGAVDRTKIMPSFFATLFRLCGSTLEALRWECKDVSLAPDRIISLDPIVLPKLRHLQLPHIPLDYSTLSSFLASPLRELEIPHYALTNLGGFLAHCEHLRGLRSLVVESMPTESEPCMRLVDLMEQNRDIKKLCVHEQNSERGDEVLLNDHIIPALAGGCFHNLRCLSLGWGGGSRDEATRPHITHIPDTALAVIGRITSLEQLSLQAGIASGWRCQWLVDHTKLRDHLKQLYRLKVLALVRDTYRTTEPEGSDVEAYYHVCFVETKEFVEAQEQAGFTATEIGINQYFQSQTASDLDETSSEIGNEVHCINVIWEVAHRDRMLLQGDAYAAVLPSLEWIYCGQRPMAIQECSQGLMTGRRAVVLTKYRSDGSKFLKRTFGLSMKYGSD